jgi:hypothetical protein
VLSEKYETGLVPAYISHVVGRFAKNYYTLLQGGAVAAEEYYCHYFCFSNIRKKMVCRL